MRAIVKIRFEFIATEVVDGADKNELFNRAMYTAQFKLLNCQDYVKATIENIEIIQESVQMPTEPSKELENCRIEEGQGKPQESI